MKKQLFFLGTIFAFATILTMSSCKQNSKTTDAEGTNDSTAVADSATTENDNPNLDYNTTDARVFGLKGYVAKVVTTTYMANQEGDKLVKMERSNRSDSLMTFDDKGRVTLDAYATPFYSFDTSLLVVFERVLIAFPVVITLTIDVTDNASLFVTSHF